MDLAQIIKLAYNHLFGQNLINATQGGIASLSTDGKKIFYVPTMTTRRFLSFTGSIKVKKVDTGRGSDDIYGALWRSGLECMKSKVLIHTATSNGRKFGARYMEETEIALPSRMFTVLGMQPLHSSYALPIVKIEDDTDFDKEKLGKKLLAAINEYFGASGDIRRDRVLVPAVLVQNCGLFVFGNTIDETVLRATALENHFRDLVNPIE